MASQPPPSPPPSPAGSAPAPRQTPAEHAARAFAPQDVPTPPVTVRGPLIATPPEPREPLAPSPAPPASPAPAPPTAPPASTDLPPPSPPPEVVPPQGEVTAAGVEIVVGDEEQAGIEAWNRERIERKMRGEYERVGRHLSELVNDNLDAPLRLNAIRILGAKSTRPSFLSRVFAPYLTPLPPPSFLSATFSPDAPAPAPPSDQTLRSLLRTTRALTETLEKFDLFRGLDATIERSDSAFAEREDVDIVLRVQEAPKYYLRTATDVGDGEGNATATAKIRNAFGGAEVIEGNLSFGTRTKSAFQLRLDTPVNASTTTHADLSIFSAQRDLNFYASCNEATKGAMARLRTLTPFGYHEFAYEAVLREIGNIAPTASMSIRNSAGPSVKSAVSHTFTRDSRDDPFVSTRGAYLRLKQEYAGLGGDAHFIRAEQEGSVARALGNGFSASLTARSGLLIPLSLSRSSKARTSLFPDRYHLGGPTSVRNFRLNTLGPRDLGDHVGGDAFYAVGASLLTPFRVPTPWRQGEGKGSWSSENLKGHVWLNAGKLIGSGQPYSTLLSTPPSLTAGFGLMYRHSLVRIEANVGVPLVQTQGEGGVKGFQFGLGLSFL
ncbi:SAM complex subunit SAM50 [Rhodotorula paludigena]|uniref:SAM complex subunit SAM50 n=1 Tax=Rhodotorula paludigena TaxID=86838 RepID=UPI00316D0F35